jgi:hypothetical protein
MQGDSCTFIKYSLRLSLPSSLDPLNCPGIYIPKFFNKIYITANKWEGTSASAIALA